MAEPENIIAMPESMIEEMRRKAFEAGYKAGYERAENVQSEPPDVESAWGRFLKAEDDDSST